MTWTPEKDAEILSLRKSGISLSEAGRIVGKSRCAVAGRLTRLGASGYAPTRIRYRSDEKSRRKYNSIDRGDWDAKTFEPYEIRKQRIAAERLRDHAET